MSPMVGDARHGTSSVVLTMVAGLGSRRKTQYRGRNHHDLLLKIVVHGGVDLSF